MNKEATNEELLGKIAELEQAVKILRQDLIHDSLTGLKTRNYFNEEAKKYFDIVIHRHQSSRKEWFGFRNLSFVFIDIDHFKKVNDTHGHQVGDKVLQVVARAIEDEVRKGDIVARWGGEEIVVALVGSNENNAKKKAEGIRVAIERLAFNSIPDMHVTVSAGVASVEVGATFDEVINRADKALYEAKESGRNKAVAWSEISD